PYESVRYGDLSPGQVEQFVAAFGRELGRVAREIRPNLVHVHHLWALTGLALEFGDLPFVVTVHGTDLKLAKTAAIHRHLAAPPPPRIGHVFCVSTEMKNEAKREYTILEEKLSILGNGYNSDLFNLDVEPEWLPGRVVLCAGKFVGWKGFRFAIRASGRV